MWEEIGIIYEITSPKGVKSYLIGTSIVDKESIQYGSFRKIIAKCSRLFSEDGTERCKTHPYREIETNAQYQHIRFRYDLDMAITLEAMTKKIPIVALDPGIDPEYDADHAKHIQDIQEKGLVTYQERRVAWLEKQNKDPDVVLAIQKWKGHDVEYLAEKRLKRPYGLTAKWEDAWMKVLLPALSETQKPICVAVYCYHVVGYKGLAERFEKAGFKVELLTRRPLNLIQRIAMRMFDGCKN
jgi:hypothetical protein